MTPHPGSGAPNPPPPRPDRYLCPVCEKWRGEHIKTGVLARHRAREGTRYDLCQGSLHPLTGLPSNRKEPAIPPTPYRQPPLFSEP